LTSNMTPAAPNLRLGLTFIERKQGPEEIISFPAPLRVFLLPFALLSTMFYLLVGICARLFAAVNRSGPDIIPGTAFWTDDWIGLLLNVFVSFVNRPGISAATGDSRVFKTNAGCPVVAASILYGPMPALPKSRSAKSSPYVKAWPRLGFCALPTFFLRLHGTRFS
jgi:hypothetical protein